jgi:hypothetical protein
MDEGYKKVSKKARRGRKRNPEGHRSHHTKGTIRDPINKAFKRTYLQKLRETDARLEERWDLI